MTYTVIIISGATGTGKTAVGTALSKIVNGEIISADSRQVYRYLDIGTNKCGTIDMHSKLRICDGIPQHITDLIDPSENFSAGTFVEHAVRHCTAIFSAGKIPVIVGGTGLYIKALVDGLAELPLADAQMRKTLTEEMHAHGPRYLYEQLLLVDPLSAQKNCLNPQRLMRALEVFRLTGTALSRLHETTKKPTDYTFLHYALDWPRQELNSILDTRTAAMFTAGLIEETHAVLNRGYTFHDPGLEGIGYRHTIQHINGTLTRAQTIEQTQRDTRHYAKRQTTWFNKDHRIHHIDCTRDTFDPLSIATTIATLIV
ncbi:MAG: tRNA (adenosine(37)-N6)-dimethylallyltransferase MiaA [Elusimicrobiota bacterium]